MQQPTVQQVATALLSRRPLASLTPKSVWSEELDQAILNWQPDHHNEAAMCLKSALHLFNENLDLSHTISQSLSSQTGSYLHGLMHRMEPDYPNAKYWFRRVGAHPIYPTLWRKIKALVQKENKAMADTHLKGQWVRWLEAEDYDPFAHVDLVEEALADTHEEMILLLKEIQHVELQVLLQYVYQQYTGGLLSEDEN